MYIISDFTSTLKRSLGSFTKAVIFGNVLESGVFKKGRSVFSVWRRTKTLIKNGGLSSQYGDERKGSFSKTLTTEYSCMTFLLALTMANVVVSLALLIQVY